MYSSTVFQKSNFLINLKNQHTTLEQKFINNTLYHVYNMENALINAVYSKEFINILGSYKSTQLKAYKIFDGIMKKPMHFIEPTDEEFNIVHMFASTKLSKQEKLIYFQLSEEYKKYCFIKNKSDDELIKLGFTNLDIESINNLSGKHAIKGYEIFKSECFASKKIEICPKELYQKLGIESNFYDSYFQFKAKLLKPMIEQINDVCKDFKLLKYEPIKNFAGKIVKIELICQKIEPKETTIFAPSQEIKPIATPTPNPVEAGINLPSPVAYMINLGGKKAELMSFWNDDKQAYLTAYNAVKSYKKPDPLVNPIGYFKNSYNNIIQSKEIIVEEAKPQDPKASFIYQNDKYAGIHKNNCENSLGQKYQTAQEYSESTKPTEEDKANFESLKEQVKNRWEVLAENEKIDVLNSLAKGENMPKSIITLAKQAIEHKKLDFNYLSSNVQFFGFFSNRVNVKTDKLKEVCTNSLLQIPNKTPAKPLLELIEGGLRDLNCGTWTGELAL